MTPLELSNRRLTSVVSKRHVKKQQMQWTPRGAHLLLQTRTTVLNDDLENVFRGSVPAVSRPGRLTPDFLTLWSPSSPLARTGNREKYA